MRLTPAIERTIESAVAGEGLELVLVEMKGQGTGQLLRVYVDQPGGVGLAECERASRALSDALDRLDAGAAGEALDAAETAPGAYTLEVSSPGLDRPLRKPEDYDRFAGQRTQVRTRAPRAGNRNFIGILQGRDAQGIRLQTGPASAGSLTFAWDEIEQARLAPLWPRPQRPGKSAV